MPPHAVIITSVEPHVFNVSWRWSGRDEMNNTIDTSKANASYQVWYGKDTEMSTDKTGRDTVSGVNRAIRILLRINLRSECHLKFLVYNLVGQISYVSSVRGGNCDEGERKVYLQQTIGGDFKIYSHIKHRKETFRR